MKNTIHEIDTRLPVFDVRPMRESTQLASTASPSYRAPWRGMFALIGLVACSNGDLRSSGISNPKSRELSGDRNTNGAGCFSGCRCAAARYAVAGIVDHRALGWRLDWRLHWD